MYNSIYYVLHLLKLQLYVFTPIAFVIIILIIIIIIIIIIIVVFKVRGRTGSL